MRAAIYARVSTLDQQPANQLQELHRYIEARAWTAVEYVDRGVSGAKDRRPALDRFVADARRRRFDVVVCWRLDRFGRNLRHLVMLLEELQALGIAFVSLGEGIDCTTPAGKLQLHILAALAEFDRARIAERVRAGLAARSCVGRAPGPSRSCPRARRPNADDAPVREGCGRRTRRFPISLAPRAIVPKTSANRVVVLAENQLGRGLSRLSRNHLFSGQIGRPANAWVTCRLTHLGVVHFEELNGIKYLCGIEVACNSREPSTCSSDVGRGRATFSDSPRLFLLPPHRSGGLPS